MVDDKEEDCLTTEIAQEEIACVHIQKDRFNIFNSFSFPIGRERFFVVCGECQEELLGKLFKADLFYRGMSGAKRKY